MEARPPPEEEEEEKETTTTLISHICRGRKDVLPE